MKNTRRRLLGLATAGLLMAPIFASSIASANTASTTITSSVTGAITTFTTSSTLAIAVASASGTKQTVNADVVTVSTNNGTGYTLKLEDSNNSAALCLTPGAGCTGIPATSGTFASPAIMSGANQWGYHIDDGTTTWCSTASNCGATFGTSLSSNQATSTTLKFAGVPVAASPDTIKTTGTTASGDVTNVWYGVNVDPTQASGSYSDSVTYTATANP